MATLWVHEGYKKDFGRKIDAYTKELLDVKSQYSSAMGITNGYGGDGNVSACNSYLQKRQRDLQNSIDRANAARDTVYAYVDSVVSVDQSIAGSIHKDSYSFYKKKGIGPQKDNFFSTAWNKISTTAKDFLFSAKETSQRIVSDIKAFYNEYKYVFDVLGDIVMVIGAVALFSVAGPTFLGIVCLIGAVWALSKAVVELGADIMAVGAWLEGDEARARELNETKLSGLIVKGARAVDSVLWGAPILETVAKVTMVGLEICQFTASCMLIFDKFKDIFNLKLRSDGKPLTVLDHKYQATWRESLRNWRMTNFAGTKGQGLRFASVTNWLKFTGWTLKFSYAKNANSVPEFVLSMLENPKANIDRIKAIVKDPSSIWKNLPVSKDANTFSSNFEEIIMA